MKIREIIFSNLDFNKCYSRHDPEQHSRDFNCRLDTLRNANVGGTVTFKSYNSQST